MTGPGSNTKASTIEQLMNNAKGAAAVVSSNKWWETGIVHTATTVEV